MNLSSKKIFLFIYIFFFYQKLYCYNNNNYNLKLFNLFEFSKTATGITYGALPLGITIISYGIMRGFSWLLLTNKSFNTLVNKFINILHAAGCVFFIYKFIKIYMVYKHNFMLNCIEPLNENYIQDDHEQTVYLYFPGYGEDYYLKYGYVEHKKTNFIPSDVSMNRLIKDGQEKEALEIIEYLESFSNLNKLHLSARSTGAQTLGLALNKIYDNEEKYKKIIQKICCIKLIVPSINHDGALGYINGMKLNPNLKIENHVVLTDTIALANPLTHISTSSIINFFSSLLKFGNPTHSNIIKDKICNNHIIKNQYLHIVHYNPDTEKTFTDNINSHNLY